MNLITDNYKTQITRWPKQGQHILAQFDAETIVVYQAYRPAIGLYAIRYGRLDGPDFSLSRMSWIKPNFLWMMYRSGWGTKEGQEITLGLRIRRRFFEQILEQAVTSSWQQTSGQSRDEWQAAVRDSEVRLQWDPDHDPAGQKQVRRAIQLGLRGEMLRAVATEEILEVIDLSPFVEAQRASATGTEQALLLTPREDVFVPQSELAKQRCGISLS